MESNGYENKNHFKKILARFQERNKLQISNNVIEQIQQKLEKENICIEELTFSKTKEIIKELGLNQYCEHINFIRIKLGVNHSVIDLETNNYLCNFNKLYNLDKIREVDIINNNIKNFIRKEKKNNYYLNINSVLKNNNCFKKDNIHLTDFGYDKIMDKIKNYYFLILYNKIILNLIILQQLKLKIPIMEKKIYF